MIYFQGKVAIRLFETVKSSPKKSNAVRSLRDLYLFLSSKTPSVYSVLNPPKTSKQSPSFHFSQDRRSLNISTNPHYFPLISKLLNGKSPSIFFPTFHFHSINFQISHIKSNAVRSLCALYQFLSSKIPSVPSVLNFHKPQYNRHPSTFPKTSGLSISLPTLTISP